MSKGMACAVLALAAGCGGAQGESVVRIGGRVMGTTWTATVVADAPLVQAEVEGLERGVQDVLDEVDRTYSTWKPDSPLSRLNGAAAGHREPFPESFGTLLETSRELHELSDGAFDPTVKALVDVWGFGSEDAPASAPGEGALDRARAAIGLDAIAYAAEDGEAWKTRDEVQLDFSSIAKGFAVDEAAEALELQGHGSFLIEVGGELVLRGQAPSGGPWKIGIDRPDPGRLLDSVTGKRELGARLTIRDGVAIATSGDYRNWREIEGRRVSHTIDPRSAHPIEHDLASVTVIGESCRWADAYATAAMVLGPEEGLALLESAAETEGYLVVRAGDGFTTLQTSGFERFLITED